jgi:histidinol-phosphate/aromatic aminotransferase/cobyric acid decarboxylase-like protein
VSAAAVAALVACSDRAAVPDAQRRAGQIGLWRGALEAGLRKLGIHYVPSSTAFVLARVGEGRHTELRAQGIAVRRADTFPGLDSSWVRIAVREEKATIRLLEALAADA